MKIKTPLLAAVLFLFLSARAHAVSAPEAVFGWDLFRVLRETPGNLFLSPESIYVAMAMTYAGARGKTAIELGNALHAPKESESWLKSTRETLDALTTPKGSGDRAYRLMLANSFWGEKSYPFLPSFKSLLQTHFHSDLFGVDFRSHPAEAARRINSWVSEKTEKKISDLISPQLIHADTKLVLVNAIYFKAAWSHAFAEKQTTRDDFYANGGKVVKVSMMKQSANVRYLDDEALQMVELPYVGGEVSMFVLLPKARDGLAALEKKLDPESFAQWSAKMGSRQVQVALPRFSVSSEFSLGTTLESLGVHAAFTPGQADFSGMTAKKDLAISQVIHKAFVNVDEAGTEAAAATAVMFFRSALALQTASFVADHPFLLVIQHRSSGSVLFVGRVENPGT